MTIADDLLKANERYVSGFPGSRPKYPSQKIAILTCMDTRLDIFGALGLNIGEAHLMRNAGGIATDDVLRSLVISQRALGTEEIVVMQHTHCGMEGFDDEAFRGQLEQETGQRPEWDVRGFDDVRASVQQSVELIRNCAWLPHRENVRGFVYDVDTARVDEVR
jgi:carbonic anhydrase